MKLSLHLQSHVRKLCCKVHFKVTGNFRATVFGIPIPLIPKTQISVTTTTLAYSALPAHLKHKHRLPGINANLSKWAWSTFLTVFSVFAPSQRLDVDECRSFTVPIAQQEFPDPPFS